jgi:hypothetical protein
VGLNGTSREEQGFPNIATEKPRAAETAQEPEVAFVSAATASNPASPIPARHWGRIAARYAAPDHRRSVLQLLTTVIPLATLWTAMTLAVGDTYWVTLLLSVPTAAFLGGVARLVEIRRGGVSSRV